MRILRRFLFVVGFCCFSFSAQGEDIEMGIVTGSEEGTYYQFGQDMSKLVAQHGIKLNVLSSRGSFENMVAIYDSRSIQLGLAQSDVVLFMNMFGEPKVQEIAKEINVVFPLYNEEIHLLGSEAISNFADLEGKKIAIGRGGSGTAMTATVLLNVAGIKPAEVLEIGGKEAIEALRKGEVDAMFYVAGYPIKLFVDEITADDKLQLISIDDPKVLELYATASTIPARTYSWQSDEVKTVDITAGLMTLNYTKDNVNCLYVGRVAKLVQENIEWLQQNGHDKWKSVDFTSAVDPTLQSPCLNTDS